MFLGVIFVEEIRDSRVLSELFVRSVPISLTLRNQFIAILRDGTRTTVWKNLQGRLTAECFPGEEAWPDGIPAVKGITILVDEKGRADSISRTYKVLLRLQLAKEPEQLWLVGNDRVENLTQLFLAYESPNTATVETVVVVEGDGKKPKSCGALSFNKECKKALNTYVRVIKALMGLSGVSLAPMLDGGSMPQLPSAPDGTAGEREAGHV